MTAFAELPATGCRLRYEHRGAGDTDHGAPLVFVHGFGLDHRLWEPQFARLGGELVRYDCRGFGASSGSLEDEYRHGADLVALLDHLGLPKVVLVGMSMGGQVVLETAVLNPERVAALVLVDPFLADFSYSEAWRGMWRALAQLAGTQGLESARETWREGMLYSMDERYPEAAQALRGMMDDWTGWHLGRPEHYPYRSISHRLGEIEAPALLTVGELDLPDFHAVADRLEAELRDVERVAIPGAGHVPNLETPEAFHRALDPFLALRRR